MRAAVARLLLAAALPCLASCTPPAAAQNDPNAARDSLFAPHRKGDRFFNPWAPDRRSVLDFLRWRLSRNPYDKSGPLDVPIVPNDGKGLAGVEHSASVTWIGHATVAVHEDGDLFLTDPHFGPRALIVPRLVPPGVPVESIPPHAFAVVSHNHYDHLDAWSVERLPAEMRWFVPLGLAEWFRDRGRNNVVELDWWQSARHGRFTVTCLPSQHWSRRIEQGENESLWCSWLVDSGKRRYYHAGDTGWFHGFAEFGRRYGPIDLAILPIGAWEPRWFMRDQHLDPAEAVRAFVDLRAQHMVGMHWGTFDLTDEPADLAPRVLAEEVAKAGGDASRVKTLAIGERWRIPDEPEPPR
jgi:N-acyl-phosphatidylethanolamine-hydrolysing phospholipase D